jgi:sulfate transport system substrate-binding protein
MKKNMLFKKCFFSLIIAVYLIMSGCTGSGQGITLLNVSYDPTREFYQEFNREFSAYFKEKTGETITIRQSHGGSGGQARSVIEGNEADIVTLALGFDIDAISDVRNMIAPDWITRFPNNSSPYTSTIVFLVRAGNPKNIRDWDDLIKEGVNVITPDPKTSGAARWGYLAAWAYARHNYGGEDNAREFVTNIFANVSVLDSGARGSTNTFVQRRLGDVLLAWENEAFLINNELGAGNFEIVTPSISIRAEPSVTYVDAVVERRGTKDAAIAFLEYLYSDSAQRMIGRHYYRPSNPEIAKEFSHIFPELLLVSIDDDFGGWRAAQALHFSDGGEFDRMITSLRRR